VKASPLVQELPVLEGDKSQRLITIWERGKLSSWHLADARDELFLSVGATDHPGRPPSAKRHPDCPRAAEMKGMFRGASKGPSGSTFMIEAVLFGDQRTTFYSLPANNQSMLTPSRSLIRMSTSPGGTAIPLSYFES
jgi:hypothetical protein